MQSEEAFQGGESIHNVVAVEFNYDQPVLSKRVNKDQSNICNIFRQRITVMWLSYIDIYIYIYHNKRS